MSLVCPIVHKIYTDRTNKTQSHLYIFSDWWCQRIKANANFYDIIRIDHFIGIVRFYSIPESCPTAMEGEWREGPGKKLTDAIARAVV